MKEFRGFTKDRLLQIYKNMKLSRELDNKMLTLLRQGKSYFHIGGSGHEAAQIGAALHFIPQKDWIYAYYRDQAFLLQ
ncbi:MAG: thiamine pyrophosphate-dependent enzyme, partial [Candidatus Calescibacterium sp.]|nr:thiamine pyrophosphate-dependent enzyme [Candidatus Calescibacterium sp.]